MFLLYLSQLFCKNLILSAQCQQFRKILWIWLHLGLYFLLFFIITLDNFSIDLAFLTLSLNSMFLFFIWEVFSLKTNSWLVFIFILLNLLEKLHDFCFSLSRVHFREYLLYPRKIECFVLQLFQDRNRFIAESLFQYFGKGALKIFEVLVHGCTSVEILNFKCYYLKI